MNHMLNDFLRPFEAADYPAITALYNSAYPDFPISVDKMRYMDERRDPRCQSQRWVVERAGAVIGVAEYDQRAWAYHPRRFRVDLAVDPACQLQGVGGRLFQQLLTALAPLDPLSLDAAAREDMPCRVQFLARRGFREQEREWASWLDVTGFDPRPFAGRVAAVEARGLEIKTLAELESDPDRYAKLYDLWCEVRQDVPMAHPEERTAVGFQEWLQSWRASPSLRPEAYFVAVEPGGQYVGQSDLYQAPEPGVLRTGLTAVRRAYRGQGVALALKLRAIERASSLGCRRIVTDNASTNLPMLAINARLGFVRQPAWILYRRTSSSTFRSPSSR
jgi:GNAT superfamily N-acetyltransferase